jgi:lipoate-protein ligase A
MVQGEATDLLAGVDGLIAGLAVTRRPVIRWSTLAHPTLFLGSSQRPSEIDLHAAAAAGVSVHKRRSGGTAVFADTQHLWLDVGLPDGHPLLLADITESYRWFGEVWAEALRAIGVDADAISSPDARALNAELDPEVKRTCFGGVSPYEVMAGKRKIVGIAQVRRRPGGLLQAGLYARWQPERVAELLTGCEDDPQERVRLLRERAVGLDELVEPSVPFGEIIRAWERALVARHDVELVDDDWTDEERAAAAEARERYAPLGLPVAGQTLGAA